MDKDGAESARYAKARPLTGEIPSAAVDAGGVVTAWGAGAHEFLGYEPTEVVGGEAARLLDGPLPAAVRHCCAERVAWTSLIALRHRNGHCLRARLQAHPLLDAAGNTHWFLTANPAEPSSATDTDDGDEQRASVLKQWALEQLPLPMGLFNHQGLIIAANAALTRAMGKPEQELIGLRIGYSAPGQLMKGVGNIGEVFDQVVQGGETAQYEAYFRAPSEAYAHAWLATLYPVKDRTGRVRAISLAAADTTEQYRARQHLSILNEAGLKIGTTLDLTRTAEELAEVATAHFADFVIVDLLDSLISGQDTERALTSDRLVFRRAAHRSVLPGCPESIVPIGGIHTYRKDSPTGRALTAEHPSLYSTDNGTLFSWAADSPERTRRIKIHGIHSLMAVPLRARGVTLGLATFWRHHTRHPFDDKDLRLGEELAARAAIYMDNARRYSKERQIALALQRSLLPYPEPRQSAVEVASRYLPADPGIGIGGDWFDVIPLSGARVALVVGDVVGHGIHASATMGRLCTAVRTLADVDLTPDELLTQLDDLVLRLDRDATENGASQAADSMVGEVGATCLYAVYDPVSHRCSMARAGHPVPALATADGNVDFLDLPAGPPLGLGGLPFEVAEFDLPEGSVLALYTDGLIESADRDGNDGRTVLRDVLSSRDRPLEDMCDSALGSLLTGLRTDDAALLLARTRALGADQVATWSLPAEPAVVARARELADGQIAAWHLEDAAFTVELVVSELVTNAIRYGRPPIQLRLIRDTALICEVSDASSTAPHLRRARIFDEGGRGLLIIAQLTQRWGCRHSRTGKTIWAELTIPAPEPEARKLGEPLRV